MSFTNEQPECPICFDTIGDKNNITTECGHKFHASCIMTNITRNGFTCPCCRSVMAEEEVLSDDESWQPDDEDDDDETLLDDDDEPFSDDALRGLRLLTNLLENEVHDQADVVAEHQYTEEVSDDTSVAHEPPPLEEVFRFLREQEVSYEQLAAFILIDHQEYEDQVQDIERFSGDLWGRLRIMISNYVPVPVQVPVQVSVQVSVPEVEVETPEWGSEILSFDFEFKDFDSEVEEDGECFIQDRRLTIADLDDLRVDLETYMIDYSAQPKTAICV